MTTDKQIFEITVWYRYYAYGEMEKNLEVHKIEANNVQEAVNKAYELYPSRRAIFFDFLYKGEKQKPTIKKATE